MMIRTAWERGLIKKGRKVKTNHDRGRNGTYVEGTIQCIHQNTFFIAVKRPKDASGSTCEEHGKGCRQWIVYAYSNSNIQFIRSPKDPVIEEI